MTANACSGVDQNGQTAVLTGHKAQNPDFHLTPLNQLFGQASDATSAHVTGQPTSPAYGSSACNHARLNTFVNSVLPHPLNLNCHLYIHDGSLFIIIYTVEG